ncbi:protein MAIN-LIKE 2-like [Vigna unguiculata]|uniref:protein MAIN-LIKE 2-like n=1 Tax=Vigna unguiculata TaxID=3917 RepID=UPI001016EC1E|nr:protein MAIN-LIKE 2-like [Vigna unguiculata]
MACVELNQSRGAQVRLSWLRDLYHSCCENELWEFAARAYLLHLVGCTIFANKSATYVRTHYLELFRNLSTCRTYGWGVAALVHLYEQLGDASFANTKQLAGYLPLLQAWIYEHFPTLGMKQVRDTYVETEPRALRYVTGRAISATADVRVQLDGLTYDGMIWNPYVAHRAA